MINWDNKVMKKNECWNNVIRWVLSNLVGIQVLVLFLWKGQEENGGNFVESVGWGLKVGYFLLLDFLFLLPFWYQ